MSRLSLAPEQLKEHYEVVVVGSGYGGAIAAARLARAGRQVCLLERGKEFQPGEYPDTEIKALQEVQFDLPHEHLGSRNGLYDFRVNEEMNAVVGCGLGGTSLINANICLRPEPRVFEDPCWPKALRDDVSTRLEEGFSRAEEMLKPVPYPTDFPTPAKLQALEKSAHHLQEKFYRPPIKVTFQDGVNHVGVLQKACTLCGDCVSGCNYAAKNTLIMNYLPDAKNHGAEIFTQIAVRRIEFRDGQWLVHFQTVKTGRERFSAPTRVVRGDIVILAAGTLGSTEILLRSQGAGLSLSDQLGRNFSGNGDTQGFAYNNEMGINGVGFGPRPPGELAPVGPTITGIIDKRYQARLEDGMVIEEGAIPGAIALFANKLFFWMRGKETGEGLANLLKKQTRKLESLIRGPYHGAMRHTQTFLTMTHDDAGGRMLLKNDRLRIAWPRVGQQPIFRKIDELLLNTTAALSGTYIKNPIWNKLFKHSLITVHPLGGCRMAEDATHGVVNHKGQVFSGNRGPQVYDNLYVCDGSIMPRPLGINPLLTICALAERSMALLAKEREWHINYQLPSSPV
jgi:cholesterol oxidase